MASLFISTVKPKTLEVIPGKKPWLTNIPDEQKDVILYKLVGPCPPPNQGGCGKYKNEKKIVVKVPAMREMLTPFLMDSIEKEMKNKYYHNIRYIEVDNKTFYKRLKKHKIHKFRYFYKGKFRTLYFNLQSKSLILKENFAIHLTLFASFPARGLTAGLPVPCKRAGSYKAPCACNASDWAIATWLKGLDPLKDEWWQIHGEPELDKYCSPTGKPCYGAPLELEHDIYYYTKPGDNDYIVECFTEEIVNNNLEGWAKTKYFILDREGEYFKKGTKNKARYSDWVLDSYNSQEYQRIELYHDKKEEVKARFVVDNFKSIDELFKKIGYSWFGRHNTFYLMWLGCVNYFNDEIIEGFYCPPDPELKIIGGGGAKLIVPNGGGIEANGFNDISDDKEFLIQQTIEWYKQPDLSIKHLDDIKIFQQEQVLYFNINTDKYLDKIRINGNTNDDFIDYAVVNYFT